MGLIRKTMSVSTLGAVSYRTDRQAARRNARLGRRHDRFQSGLLAVQARQGARGYRQAERHALIAQAQAQPRPAPPGWYYDSAYGCMRWWNGLAWTEFTSSPA